MRITPERIDPSLLALLAEGFSSRLSFGLVSFALPLYAYHLWVNLTGIGLITSLNLIVEQAFKHLMGWSGTRVGIKRRLSQTIGVCTDCVHWIVYVGEPVS